jgi:hypothetical protein
LSTFNRCYVSSSADISSRGQCYHFKKCFWFYIFYSKYCYVYYDRYWTRHCFSRKLAKLIIITLTLGTPFS